MNIDTNSIIIVALIGILLAGVICYCWGNRNGIKEGREEKEQEAAKIAARQRRYALN